MKKLSAIRSSSAVVLSLALSSLATPGYAKLPDAVTPPKRGAVIVDGEGAELRGSGASSWLPGLPGARLGPRAQVRSGDVPVSLLLPGGALVHLGPHSAVQLAGTADVVLGFEGKVAAQRIELRGGEIQVEVPAAKRAVMPLVISDGELMVAARPGTKLAMRTLDARGGRKAGLAVACYEGDARVATRGAFKPLPAGLAVELRTREVVPTGHRLAAAPAWSREGHGTRRPLAIVTSEEERASVALDFEPVAGATGYEAEVAIDEGFTRVIARSSLGPGATSVATPPLGRGRYSIRVRTRGPEGLTGLPGEPGTVRVALAAVPAGGVAHEGTFVLPAARLVTGGAPHALEISLGKTGFLRASSLLLATHGERVSGRVRLAGDCASVPITLVPTSLGAIVELGPKKARWPFDPVAAMVRIVDSGRPVDTIEPKLRVTVNMTEVPVEWWRRGDVWRARIPAQVPPGPWVVRVEAFDQHDNELGRGHLEVVGPRKGDASELSE